MENKKARQKFKGDALILFPDVPTAMKGQKTLKGTDFETKLVAPPPNFRLGCELGLEIMQSDYPAIVALFESKGVEFSRMVPLA